MVCRERAAAASHVEQHLHNELAQRAATNDGRMGILGVHDVELARPHGEVGGGGFGVEREVGCLVEGFIRVRGERMQSRPAYRFLAAQGHVDVDVTAMHLEFLLLAGAQRGIVHVDEELLGNERDAARRSLSQAVVENVFERLPKEVEDLLKSKTNQTTE